MRHLSLWTLGIIPTRSGAQYQAPEIPGEELRGTARVPRNSRVRASRPGINIYTEGGLYLTNVAPVGYGGRNRFFWAGALSGNLHGLYEASGGAGSRTTPVALDYIAGWCCSQMIRVPCMACVGMLWRFLLRHAFTDPLTNVRLELSPASSVSSRIFPSAAKGRWWEWPSHR